MFDRFVDKLIDELDEVDKKVGSGQDLDASEYECADVWAHTLKDLLTAEAMIMHGDEKEERWSYADERRSGRYSRDDGMGGTRRMYSNRSMRRGSRNDGGYSYHGDGDDMYIKLQEAHDNATSEQERKTIRKLMDQMGY